MDRLFLDACVLFSAGYSPKSPLRCLWELKDVVLLSSAYVIAEAERNLSRLRLEQMDDLKRLEEQLTLVKDSPTTAMEEAINLPEKDLPVLMAAVKAKATHLLTVDKKHFGPFYEQKLGGALVLTPGEYLRRIRIR